MREALGLLLAALVGTAGCTTPDAHLKPPKHPEEYNLPPKDDPRYSLPIEYPKSVMETDPLLKKAKDPGKMNGLDGASNRFGGLGRN
jgi:hypothetical protein